DYWTAAYAVTVAQYAGFMHDGGYSERWRTCWTSAGWDWKRHYGLEAPMDWQSPLAAERIGNHPVEVTWYEAYAYAGWLEALRRDGSLVLPREIPAEHVIRLPDEVEREWAARYPDGRVYPWGTEYRAGCANVDETSYYEKVGPYY